MKIFLDMIAKTGTDDQPFGWQKLVRFFCFLLQLKMQAQEPLWQRQLIDQVWLLQSTHKKCWSELTRAMLATDELRCLLLMLWLAVLSALAANRGCHCAEIRLGLETNTTVAKRLRKQQKKRLGRNATSLP